MARKTDRRKSFRSSKRRDEPRSPNRGGRKQIKASLEQAFRHRFPHDTVDVSDGYMENIHVLVVSRDFDGMAEQEKQDMMWRIIDQSPLCEADKTLISLVLPLSPSQVK